MALTRDFKETVAARVRTDAAFAQALLDEAAALCANGEPECAKMVLRDVVHAADSKAEAGTYQAIVSFVSGTSCRR